MRDSRIIIHIRGDDPDDEVTSVVMRCDAGAAPSVPVTALQAAVDAYIRTPDGQVYFAGNGDSVTWGDVARLAALGELAETLTAPLGFVIEPAFDDEYSVNADDEASTTT